ncbi:MAG: DEAD/DEAH box helicase family protein [Bacteroides sp.]|nr:DEAD/DEAH box helicase family protein [Bacteroides sp.]
MRTPKQFNNITERVIDDLKQVLSSGNSQISIAAASFSIYAYEALKEELEKVDCVNFIFTSPTFYTDKSEKQKREFYIPKLNRERSLFGSDFEIRLRNQLTQRAIAKECADWIRRKARFKTNITHGSMNTFLNIKEGEETYTYMPFNEFTTTELGLDRGNNICPMVVGMPGHSSTDMFLKNFAELWKDKEKFQDVTDNVIENIETVYKENAPAFIYFITLYNIFNEFLEDISEDVLPNEATGFKSSVIWNKLYNFQRDASLATINKLEKYNGCILADSVGLGKTFTALSVIKYYENRNRNVLVLCPKKLNDNWQTFRSNYKNNPVLADRLRYDILFHSDLSRDRGLSNGLDLERVNWGNYDLIVIDESHNFRNGGRFDNDDEEDDFKENRYARLMNKVIRSGVKTKVLMLSATPVNNRFSDLKNQLQLAYEGKAENINDLLDTGKSIDSIFRDAQTVYSKWSKLPPEMRTTEKLVDSLSYDFFQLLDAVTIARSRSHIIKYYNTNDVGKFPTRLSPVSRRPKLTDLNDAITFADIAGLLDKLNLSIYTPSLFIFDSVKDNYGIDFQGEGLTVDGREKGIRKLMAINLLKRLESSVNSFRLTLTRIHDFIKDSITAIDKFQESSSAETIDVTDFSEDFDAEDSENDPFVGRKSKINLRDMDYVSWRRDLKADLEVLELLILMLKDITPEHDTKLQQLVADLKNKFEHPINGINRKVLIFTAFADTANYLYEQLSGRILNDCGLHTALITGSTEGKCTLPKLKCTFNDILTYFSPISKDRDAIHPNDTREIDVLIATDCISEGQNLQDCDYLINYDIHWNPVRIIQRFGRIDRIGSRNDVIQLVNYWPDMELDDYIKLKGRVESRMKATVITSTGDDNLLSDNEKGDLEYRRNQLKKLQNEVVDIEDMDTGVNIMDLGLNEFRLDLLANLKEHPNMDLVPFGMSAVVGASELVEPGVMFVLKNKNNGVNIDRSNLLHPFYMVYLSHTGTVLCDHLSPKKLLDKMRYACKDKTDPDSTLCKQFNKETRDGKNMRHYSNLLQSAIESIITVKEKSDIDDFLNGVQGNLFAGEIRGLDDFELICFLVIK